MSANIEIREEVAWTQLGDEVAILDLVAGEYFGLAGAGARIWCLIAANADTEKIVATLLDEFDAPEEQIRHDLEHFIRTLKAKRLLRGAA